MNRAQIIGAILAGAVVVGGGVALLLSGGDDEPPPTAAEPDADPGPVDEEPDVEPAPEGEAEDPEEAEVAEDLCVPLSGTAVRAAGEIDGFPPGEQVGNILVLGGGVSVRFLVEGPVEDNSASFTLVYSEGNSLHAWGWEAPAEVIYDDATGAVSGWIDLTHAADAAEPDRQRADIDLTYDPGAQLVSGSIVHPEMTFTMELSAQVSDFEYYEDESCYPEPMVVLGPDQAGGLQRVTRLDGGDTEVIHRHESMGRTGLETEYLAWGHYGTDAEGEVVVAFYGGPWTTRRHEADLSASAESMLETLFQTSFPNDARTGGALTTYDAGPMGGHVWCQSFESGNHACGWVDEDTVGHVYSWAASEAETVAILLALRADIDLS